MPYMPFFKKNTIYKIIFIIFIFLILDFVIIQIFGNKINDLMYGKYDTSNKSAYNNRIKDHHELKKNQELTRKWHKTYLHKTDKYGNRIGDCPTNNKNKKSIFIVGDSMVEGIGINYEDTFVGLLNCNFNNLNILNLGVASYSPILYHEKIKKITSKVGKPHSVFIFLGINDIQDDANYIKIKNRIYDSSEKNYFSENEIIGYLFNDIKFFLKNSFLTFKFIDLIKDNYEKRNRKKNNSKNRLYLNLGINHPQNIWTFDEKSYLKYGKKGLIKSKNNLDKIYKYSLDNNFKFYLVIWPSTDQIYYNDTNSIHRKYWKKWSDEKKIKLIDLNKFFFEKEKKETIKKYFIPGDTHWNKYGHKLIYENLSKEIRKINF